MNINDLCNLIIQKKEKDIPRDVNIEDLKKAYMLAYHERPYQHPLEKEDEYNYGYLGTLRLRDTLPTFEYVKKERNEIKNKAKLYDNNIHKIAYVYDYLVKNFKINLKYMEAFNYYYKNYSTIFSKSDKEIKEYFEKINPYLHPFKEVIIDNKKFYANTRVDLFETRCSAESIIADEFISLVEDLIPNVIINSFVVEKDNKTFTVVSINLGTKENPIKMNFIPTKDIYDMQINNDAKTSYDCFNIDNDKLVNDFKSNSPIVYADKNDYVTKEVFDGLSDQKNINQNPLPNLFRTHSSDNDGM